MNKVTLRQLIIGILLLGFLFGIIYKYFEWNTVKSLANLYNTSWKNEFKLVQSNTTEYDDFNQFSNKVFSSKDPESFHNSYSDLNGKLNLFIQSEEQYLSTVNQTRNNYLSLRNSTGFLFGPRGDFAKKLVNLQIQYYDNEIANGNRGLASLYLQSDLYSLWYDKTLADAFDKDISANPKVNIPKYFADISSLQSYTNPDFSFSHADQIKTYFPDGYDALSKYKDFLSNYYTVVQDIINGDYDSAAYNYTSISNNISNLTLNFKGIYGTGKDQANQRSENIADEVANGVLLIKQFKNDNLDVYPFLPSISTWKEDLVMCQLYDFKSTTIYPNVTSKYPSAKNFNDLLSELSSVNPNTDNVDKYFDKSIVKFTNNDKKIEFQCKDKYAGDTLTFSFTKPSSQ